ncbi:MAG: hypothetical protein ACTHMC_16570 [Pseudobacter sp.]|uniref:hypothetical protein n=1 Tax=Pseudobacter sp. TaxID=2045420 RepID=UPI003F8111C5
MLRYLEPVPGAGFVKTDHEYIYFWRMNAEQIATWLENRTEHSIITKKQVSPDYYSFSIPNHAKTPALIAAFNHLGVRITFNGHGKNK